MAPSPGPSPAPDPAPDPASDPDRTSPPRPGEVVVSPDPATQPADAGVVFIGRLRTPWTETQSAPRNLTEAIARGTPPARAEIAVPYRPGLRGLDAVSHVILLYWMDRARRDVIVQTPRRRPDGPVGVFRLRSPLRPNPIALAAVPLLAVDVDSGVLSLGPLDCLDGTPLLDIKPYIPELDAHPQAIAP